MSPLSCTFLPPPTLSHSSELLQSPRLISLSQTANFHWLSILHMEVYKQIFEDEGFWRKLPACCMDLTRGPQGCLLTCKCKAKSFKRPPRDCKLYPHYRLSF